MATKIVTLDYQPKLRDLTCAFSPDRTRAITGVVGRSVRLWDLETGSRLHQFDGHKQRIWGLAWSGDGLYILSGSWDNTARVWDVNTGECLQVLEGHTGFIRDLAFSADQRSVITASGESNGPCVGRPDRPVPARVHRSHRRRLLRPALISRTASRIGLSRWHG